MSLKKIDVDFYFDYSCPWTYLGFRRLVQTATRTGSDIIWKPINLQLVKEILNKTPVPLTDYQKIYRKKDLQDWSTYCTVVINHMDNIDHSVSMMASKGALYAVKEGLIKEYSEEVFKAFFSEIKDISVTENLLKISENIGLDVNNFEAYLNDSKNITVIEDNSKELSQKGGYGSPTMFVEDKMFFGNDRMNLVEFAIGQASGRVLVIPGQHNS